MVALPVVAMVAGNAAVLVVFVAVARILRARVRIRTFHKSDSSIAGSA